MPLRTGHGKGRGVPRIEVLPPDELPSATPSVSDRIERTPDGRFTAGNTVARSKRLRVVSALTAAANSDFAPFARWGKRYAAHRRSELAAAHGGSISAGVGALIESASMQLASSRYLAAKGAASGDAAMMKTSSALANDARQNELTAWELAAREAKVRRGAERGQKTALERLAERTAAK